MESWYPGADTAGPGRRYKGSNAPFLIKDGKLTNFAPARVMELIVQPGLQPSARRILLYGLVAWVVCPTKIIKSKHKGHPATGSGTFVQDEMLLAALDDLATAFRVARGIQMLKKDWSARTLVNHRFVVDFPFELLFAIGGLEAAFEANAAGVHQLMMENQEQPVRNMVVMLKVIHFRHQQIERDRASKERIPVWGVNTAKSIASELLHKSSPRAAGEDSISGHWQALRLSTPYIYAASLIEDGRFLDSFFRRRDDELEGPEEFEDQLKLWSSYTAIVAERLLKPLGHASEPKLYPVVDASAVTLPPPMLTADEQAFLEERTKRRSTLRKWD